MSATARASARSRGSDVETTATGDATKLRILREAAALFRERHYGGVSTRDIADACGIRQPTIYWYFPTKLAIMVELIQMDLAVARPLARWLSRETTSPASRLYRFLVEDMHHLVNDPYNMAAIYDTNVLDQTDFADVSQHARDIKTSLRHIIRQGIAAGQFIDAPLEIMREMIAGVEMHAGRMAPQASRSQRSDLPEGFATLAVRSLLVDTTTLEDVRKEARGLQFPSALEKMISQRAD